MPPAGLPTPSSAPGPDEPAPVRDQPAASLTPFTNKVGQIDRGLDRPPRRLAAASTTPFFSAPTRSASCGRSPRRVLVIVSDGDDTAQNTTYAQALEAALHNQVMIYTIINVPIEASAGRDLAGEHALITLAEQTGGKSYYENQGGLDKAFDRLSQDLRTQYLLGYYPKNQEPGRAFHRVQVTIPRAAPDAFTILHKTGYYTAPPPAAN